MATISLTVNGRAVSIEAAPEMPLLWALRDSLGLVGTKFGCGGGFCGACTVHVDGAATRSCTLPLAKIGGRTIVTIEGLSDTGPVKLTFDNSPPDGSPGVLLGFLEGRRARELGRLPAEARRAAVIDCFTRLYGPRAARPLVSS